MFFRQIMFFFINVCFSGKKINTKKYDFEWSQATPNVQPVNKIIYQFIQSGFQQILIKL